jgi:hypothetical protein
VADTDSGVDADAIVGAAAVAVAVADELAVMDIDEPPFTVAASSARAIARASTVCVAEGAELLTTAAVTPSAAAAVAVATGWNMTAGPAPSADAWWPSVAAPVAMATGCSPLLAK